MSGHSKWAQIKRQKGRADAKRSSLFTKLSQLIATAARTGADPVTNFRLRLAIEKARAANMPQSNVERAIQRGSRAEEGAKLEEVTYEAYAPAGVALLIAAVTDNRNRTTAQVRTVLANYQATLANAGSVSRLFQPKGVIRLTAEHQTGVTEELELNLIDAGAEDLRRDANGLTIVSPAGELESVRAVLVSQGVTVDDASLEYRPATPIEVPANTQERLNRLIEDLDALEDIQDVYTNARETV